MIEIIQKKISKQTLMNPYNKMEEISVSVNRDLINKDISRLKEMLDDTKNKYNKKNIKALISYLNKLLKSILDDSTFEMCWNTDKDIPYTYPLNLINERLYGIDICNYIEVEEDEKLVQMNMTSLADIIAFELMSRDIGETHDSIEELLKDCGIIGFEPASLLTDFFASNGDNMFELSKSMKIEDTPYYSFDNKTVHDYFSSKEFKTDKYRDVVSYSCKYANTIIANSIIKNCLHSNINIKLLMLNATDIVFIVKDTDEVNIKGNIIEEISIRTFGRRFKVEPDIQIF